MGAGQERPENCTKCILETNQINKGQVFILINQTNNFEAKINVYDSFYLYKNILL
jgi:hypothetical protein